MGLKLKIKQGATYIKQFRWEAEPFVYKQISGITNAAPVVLHVPAHGLLIDQLFAVQNAGGMAEINTKDASSLKDWYRATIVDPDHIEINKINSTGFKPFTTGGNILYRSVVDLTGYTARMLIRDRIGGNILHTMTTELGNIAIDNANKFITLTFTDTETELFSWKKGVYDLEMVSPAGIVTSILEGEVYVSKEVTTL